jgi:hypothetical protein
MSESLNFKIRPISLKERRLTCSESGQYRLLHVAGIAADEQRLGRWGHPGKGS